MHMKMIDLLYIVIFSQQKLFTVCRFSLIFPFFYFSEIFLQAGFGSWRSMYKKVLEYFDYPIDCSKMRCDHIESEFFKLPLNMGNE